MPPFELSEIVADALIATAHAARDDSDRRALNAYRQAQIAVEEILALVRDAPLDADDLNRINAALNLRQAEDRATRELALDKVRTEARDTTSTVESAVGGRNPIIRVGQGWIEARYVRDPDTGRTNGPYLYQRWREAGRKRTPYLGKAAAQ